MSDRLNPGLLCPVCRVDLVMADRQGVEVDYCPKCRGVWLDRGELDKIIERSSTYEAQSHRPDYERSERVAQPRYEDYSHDKYNKPHKRKSFLGEIFDFD